MHRLDLCRNDNSFERRTHSSKKLRTDHYKEDSGGDDYSEGGLLWQRVKAFSGVSDRLAVAFNLSFM